MRKSVEQRLLSLEGSISGVPGTSLTRVLGEEEGVEWCLAIGGMMAPKRFFHGATIREVLNLAESFFAKEE